MGGERQTRFLGFLGGIKVPNLEALSGFGEKGNKAD
jgi:hypothetical protein